MSQGLLRKETQKRMRRVGALWTCAVWIWHGWLLLLGQHPFHWLRKDRSCGCAVGTLMSCLIGAILRVPLGHVLWVCGPLAVAVSQAAMQLTNTLHPPGKCLHLKAPLPQPNPLSGNHAARQHPPPLPAPPSGCHAAHQHPSSPWQVSTPDSPPAPTQPSLRQSCSSPTSSPLPAPLSGCHAAHQHPSSPWQVSTPESPPAPTQPSRRLPCSSPTPCIPLASVYT